MVVSNAAKETRGAKREEILRETARNREPRAVRGKSFGGGGRILNSHLSRLLLGRPAVLMKTSEQADSPTLLETGGRVSERERVQEKTGRDGRVIMKQSGRSLS